MAESRPTVPASHEFFQAWQHYELVIRHNYMRHREVIAALEKWRDRSPHPTMSILDLGCGDAVVSTTVFGRQRGVYYCGVDLSGGALIVARERTHGLGWNTEWIEADLLSATRRLNRRFDLVIAGYSLHHLREHDLAQTLQQVKRLLRNRGSFMVYDTLRGVAESRDAFIGRFLTAVDASWDAFELAQRQAIREHVERYDFPIDLEQWAVLSARSAFAGRESLYRDEANFYRLLHFWKSTGRVADKVASGN